VHDRLYVSESFAFLPLRNRADPLRVFHPQPDRQRRGNCDLANVLADLLPLKRNSKLRSFVSLNRPIRISLSVCLPLSSRVSIQSRELAEGSIQNEPHISITSFDSSPPSARRLHDRNFHAFRTFACCFGITVRRVTARWG